MILISIFCIKQGTGGGGDSFYTCTLQTVPKIGCSMNNMENIIYDISRVHQLALRFGEAFICFTEFIVLAHQGVVPPNLFVKCGCKGLTT